VGLGRPIPCEPIELRLSIIWRQFSGVVFPAVSSMRTYGCPGTAIDRGATVSKLTGLSMKALIPPSVTLLHDEDRAAGRTGDSPWNPSNLMVPVIVNEPDVLPAPEPPQGCGCGGLQELRRLHWGAANGCDTSFVPRRLS